MRLHTADMRADMRAGGRNYTVLSLRRLCNKIGIDINRLPYSLRVLMENAARSQPDGENGAIDVMKAFADWAEHGTSGGEISFRPSRVLMQDFTGVPAVVDLAAMRDAAAALGGDPERVNPSIPVDLVVDHSVQVDHCASADACRRNEELEMRRNRERYELLRWATSAFGNLRVVPPGRGICHQVNLECLASVVAAAADGDETIAFPDTLVGTDSHTPTVNGLGVLGWGVGGIEAEAAMLGQAIVMQLPDVVGVRLSGKLPENVTATDLVLTITEQLRKLGVVGKFVEFCGPGLAALPVTDRATVANMAPEYGATCGFFPIDTQTVAYLRNTGRSDEQIALVETYARTQCLWRDPEAPEPLFSETTGVDLSSVEPSVAGPRRPQDRLALSEAAEAVRPGAAPAGPAETAPQRAPVAGKDFDLGPGDIVIASITSCTITANPHAMITAGLLARNARRLGLRSAPWVKTSLAPGSRVVTRYLRACGLQEDLDYLGFHLAGYGCMTCIGNSGPLDPAIEDAVRASGLEVAAVLSGNRNFEGRVHPLTCHNFLMSPALVVAYALAGSMTIDLTREPVAKNSRGNKVYLADLWPASREVNRCVEQVLNADLFRQEYSGLFEGDAEWRALGQATGSTYSWNGQSTYIRRPPFFEGLTSEPPAIRDVTGARILALLGDSITTDHISPAGAIAEDSPAGQYLKSLGVSRAEFNSYGSRRGNHEVMMRGTFANVRLRNEMTPEREGGYTMHVPSLKEMSVYDAAMKYEAEGTPLVIVAGREYGTGSSRDWAAKGPLLLGVRAVIAESFERIHRSNLAGMGVLPLVFPDGENRKSICLDGHETVSLEGLAGGVKPGMEVACTFTRGDDFRKTVLLRCRLDTAEECECFANGGILPKVVREIAAAARG